MVSVFFYLFVFALVFVIQLLAIRQRNNLFKKVLILFSFFIILLLIGLRYEVGTDYIGHVRMYNDFDGLPVSRLFVFDREFGARIIMGIASHVFDDVKAIFWIYGFLSLFPIYIINKNSNFKYLPYSFLVYNLTILPVSLNLVRQGAAMSFALLCFDYLRVSAPKLKVFLSAFIAIILHTSALLMIPYLFAYWLAKKFHKRYSRVVYILTIIISLSLFGFLGSFLNDIGLSGYDYMLETTKGVGFSLGPFVYYLVYYLMLIIVIIIYKRNGVREGSDNNKRDIDDSLSMIISGTVLDFVGSATKYLSRISYYFSIYQILLLPECIQNIESAKMRRITKIICVCTLVALFIFQCYTLGYYEIIPYKTWVLN